MPHQAHIGDVSCHGTIRDVFGHRFVLATDNGPILANVGRHAPKSVSLKPGAKVKISGEQTPCEIRIHLFLSGRGKTIEIPYKSKKIHLHEEDGTAAVKAALDAGYIVEGEPKRKAKHFELNSIRGGTRYKLHIMPNGDIRKEKRLQKSAPNRKIR